MPELPEVETIKNGLANKLHNKIISDAVINRPNLRTFFPDNFTENLKDKKLTAFKRRSKYLLIELDNDYILISHLGMSGKFTIFSDNEDYPKDKHDHVVINFTDGSSLVYNDIRRFGLMDFVQKNELEKHKLFVNLAPEPLTQDFNTDYLYNILKNKKTNIKNAIMDSHIVVGVGNIYACESLFKCKISPTRSCNTIKSSEISKLIDIIKETLKEAIASGGSTLKDYRKEDGTMGYFQHSFKVYGREKEKCTICSSKIERIKQQGRSTFFCPECQK